MARKIGIVVGSLRKGSYHRKIGKVIAGLFPEGYEVSTLEIGDLPLYNEDLEENLPPSWVRVRAQVEAFDGVVFVAPEYNRSVTGAMKNVIDICSRPYGSNKWDGTPALIVSGSSGAISGFGANHHLRQMLTFVNMPVVQQPEVYLASIQTMFSDDGVLKESVVEFLKVAIKAFVHLMDVHAAA